MQDGIINMPIDDALEKLEGVPEHVLSKLPKLKIPEDIEELRIKYANKFKIYENHEDEDWLEIETLESDYKDIYGERRHRLQYSHRFGKKEYAGDPLKCAYLCNDSSVWQSVYCITEDHYTRYIIQNNFKSTPSETEKIKLEKWFKETEKFFLENIPELEEFVKNYDANR
jgi:hypothetical protein